METAIQDAIVLVEFLPTLVNDCLSSDVKPMFNPVLYELMSARKVVKLSSDQAIDLAQGVLEGLFPSESVDISTCIYDTESIITNMTLAINEIKASEWREALAYIGKAMSDVPEAITICKSTATDMAAILNQLNYDFKHPLSLIWELGKHLFLNGIDIYSNIIKA